MVVEVEVGIVHPDRSALPVGHLHDPVAHPRHAVETTADVGADLVESDAARIVSQWTAVDDRDGADVLRLVRGLDPQKRGVGGREPFVEHRGVS